MKKLFYFFAIFASATAFAQQNSGKPVVLVDGMLASSSLVAQDKKNIQTTNTYKSGNLPQNLKSFESLAANGITAVKVKENYYDRISLKELNQGFKLADNSPVNFDGNIISNTDLIVLGNVLEHMEVTEVNGKKMLSISTTPKSTSASALK